MKMKWRPTNPSAARLRTTEVTETSATEGGSRPRLAAGLIGVLAAAVALGVAEPLAALVRSEAAPLVAVGSAAIDLSPEWLKRFAIRTFGERDKTVLLAGMGVVVTLLAVTVGQVARRDRRRGIGALAAFGLVGVIAAATRPNAGPLDALPSLVGCAAGAVTLVLLSRAADRTFAPEPSDGDVPGARPERRAFLLAGAGAAALAGLGAVLGRTLVTRGEVKAARRAVGGRLPRPARPAAPLPAGADLRIPGLTPFVTPDRDFYRVDTALTLPQVDPADWILRVHGMVDRPIELTFDDLLRRPLVEHDITLACVSNEVGGEYVGNARWLGASLAQLLREAGVRAEADQILSRSADGWTCSTPIETVMDGRESLLAVAMNGAPLPVAHGFPARMVVPGLYGYVSATKWVVDLKLTRFTDSAAYWTTRGWAERAPIKTMARIDLPAPSGSVRAGRVPVAGVAWAQHRGISAVEVRVDKGPWRQARLAPVPGTDTWRQWVWEWEAAPGKHRLEVRATDGTGATQPGEYRPPAPDGATGWHSVEVTVKTAT